MRRIVRLLFPLCVAPFLIVACGSVEAAQRPLQRASGFQRHTSSAINGKSAESTVETATARSSVSASEQSETESHHETYSSRATLIGMISEREENSQRIIAFPPDATHHAEPQELQLYKYTYIRTIHWQGWGTPTARGVGVEWNNNCDPSCAAGQYIDMGPATIKLEELVPGNCVVGSREEAVQFYTKITLAVPMQGREGRAGSGTTLLRAGCSPPSPGEEVPYEAPQRGGPPQGPALSYLSATQRAELAKAAYPVLLPPHIPAGWYKPAITIPARPKQGWYVQFSHQVGDQFYGGSLSASPASEAECGWLEHTYGSRYLNCDAFPARGGEVVESNAPDSGSAFYWVKCGTGFTLKFEQTTARVPAEAQQIIHELTPAHVGPAATGC